MMVDTNCRLAGILSQHDTAEGHEALWCGDIIVAEWAEDHIGTRLAHVWGDSSNLLVMSRDEAEDATRQYNKFVSLRYWIADEPQPDDAIKRRAIEQVYGATQVQWGARYSEITGYLWTDEDFVIGGHDMIGRLSSEVGKYLLLEMTVHDKPRDDIKASHYLR